MNIFNIKKLPIFLTVLSLFMLLLCNGSAFASDYKYKVLDTKYNPSAAKLTDGSIEIPKTEYASSIEKKGFDFLRFLAFITALAFSAVILKYSCKTFVKVFDELKEKGIDYVPEEKITESAHAVENEKTTQKNKQKSLKAETLKKEVRIQKTNKSIAVTTPIQSKKTIMINKAKLTRDKGLCIVQHEDKFALIGYINSKVFMLKKFDELQHKEIRPRWTETINDKDRYIVRLGTSYKALVEVGEKDINLLIEL